ncbi:macrophage mannose receptor 1-like [Cyclopterus lumpus]|uniref:macrophage mannose receptor 1-like n=1 Tax=Cyclopterus lumpus TaxID=8103 RepID=UPI0014860E10|nr:macrophage mannose receptor 1-like [Cyclopterus lumpus]
MNWTDAQQYCREKYSDLATLDSIDDVRRLPDVIGLTWIGLRDDPQSWKYSMGNDTNSWRWSATGGTGRTSRTGYQNWKASQPSGSTESQLCIWMSSGGTWSDAGCETALYFLCYTQTTQTDKTYVLIYMVKKWSDARDYCREHHTDLAMIENDEENKAVAAQLGGYYGWIGLYRVRWTWSDKSQSSFRFWGPGAPQYFHSQEDCVAMRSLHKWDDANCKSEYHFMCHQVLKLKTKLRLKFKTSADITDPASNAQILQQLSVALTRQGWTDFKLKWNAPPRKQEKRTEF